MQKSQTFLDYSWQLISTFLFGRSCDGVQTSLSLDDKFVRFERCAICAFFLVCFLKKLRDGDQLFLSRAC